MIEALAAAAAAAGAGTLAWGAYNPRSRLFGDLVRHGDGTRPHLYLTFDDGPNPYATPAILEALAAAGVPATFFMVGRHIARFPAIAKAVADAGHAVGNHTWSHVKLHTRGPRRIAVELARCHAAITDTVGVRPRTFRAPHGYRNPFVARCTSRLGYRAVAWNVGVWDTACPGAEVIRTRVRRALAPGRILLLHDGDGYDPFGDRRQTAAALAGIVRDAHDAGFRFRPLSDLLS
jgi:peptidoglycan/xylan/chitin deacetylase (PgdA/CDA1 family)